MQGEEEISKEVLETIEKAVRRACAESKAEEKKSKRKKAFYDTRRLMESYIDFRNFVNNAVTEESEVQNSAYEIFKGENARLDSVKKSKMVTAMMLINIDMAMEELEKEYRRKGILYKFESFKMYYVDGISLEEIAERLNCGKNSPSNWNKSVLRKLSIKLYGLCGL